MGVRNKCASTYLDPELYFTRRPVPFITRQQDHVMTHHSILRHATTLFFSSLVICTVLDYCYPPRSRAHKHLLKLVDFFSLQKSCVGSWFEPGSHKSLLNDRERTRTTGSVRGGSMLIPIAGLKPAHISSK